MYIKLSDFKRSIGFCAALLSVAAEVYMAKYLPGCALQWVQLSFIIFVGLLFALLYLIKKGAYILQSFLVIFHNHAGTVPGIFMIVYLLVQIDLAGSSFHEFLTSPRALWTEPLTYLGLLFFPFLLQAFGIGEKNKKVDEEKRRVLVTALSTNSPTDLANFKQNQFDRDKIIEDIKAYNDDPANVRKKPRIWNWTSFDLALNKYPQMEKFVFLIDKKVKEQLHEYKEKNDHEDILKTYATVKGDKLRRTLKIEKIYLDDINDFNAMYDEVKPKIEAALAKYDDEQIIFNISPGTATVTATLTFLSVKGKRGFCYLEQKETGAQLKEFYVSAYDLRELWSEIIEKL